MGDLEGHEDLVAGAFAGEDALVVLVREGSGEDDDEDGGDGGEPECREVEDAGTARRGRGGRLRRGLGVGRDLLHDAGGEVGWGAARAKGLTQVVLQLRGLEFGVVEFGVFELAVVVNHGCTP